MRQLKAAGGHLVNIVQELDEHYVISYADPEDARRDPFVIRKDNDNYTPYDLSRETPQAGDIVAGGRDSWNERYRVLGATDTQMLIVEAKAYADGEWPTVGDSIQLEVTLPAERTMVYIRQLPDGYLKVVERPDVR